MDTSIKDRTLVFSAKNINKIYKTGNIETHAIRDVSFEVYEGDFVVVLGPSGSGKSTLLNLLGGMDSITSGELFYRGDAIHSLSKKEKSRYRRNVIGFVFQFYNLLPSLNCYENISITAELSKKSFPIDQIIRQVGLEGREKHFPSQLSGGQQQRVALARAIVKSPDVLLCDEPTGALDTETSMQVLELLEQINKDMGKTIIVISHDQELIKFAKRCFYIRDGKLTEKEVF